MAKLPFQSTLDAGHHPPMTLPRHWVNDTLHVDTAVHGPATPSRQHDFSPACNLCSLLGQWTRAWKIPIRAVIITRTPGASVFRLLGAWHGLFSWSTPPSPASRPMPRRPGGAPPALRSVVNPSCCYAGIQSLATCDYFCSCSPNVHQPPCSHATLFCH